MNQFNRRISLIIFGAALWVWPLPHAMAYDVMDTATLKSPVEQTFSMLRAGNWQAAYQYAAATNNPVLQKYAYWRYLKDDSTAPTFDQLSQFIATNPNWPMLRSIAVKAETSIPAEWPADQVIAWFNTNPAISLDGKKRLAEAWIDKKEIAIAKPLIREYWRGASMGGDYEKKFLGDYRHLLQSADHQARLDMLIRGKSYTAARNLAKYLGDGYPALIDAKIALQENKPAASKLLNRVSAKWQNDPGLMYLRLKKFRDDDRNGQAIAILNAQPKDLDATIEQWWDERHIIARRMIKKGDFQTAYQLARRHGLNDGNSYIEAEFLAGWLALQKLNRPDAALAHFKNIHDHSTSPISLARAYYWMGRAEKDLHRYDLAKIDFLNASQYPSSFYGQLARQYLGDDITPFDLPKLPPITAEQNQQFYAGELPQIIRLLNAVGDKQAADIFTMHMANTATTGEQLSLIIQMTADMRRPDLAVAIARQSRLKGIDLIEAGFPMMELAGGKSPETSLVYSIIRQESSFNSSSKSVAGALGLMQLMPAVAKSLAKQKGISYRESWLVDRPEYNVTLGKILLDGKIKYYDGSYALAIAAYNAGPSRVNEWLENYGDPRDGKTDLVDWIENIPYGETRNYVHRVLENMVIYRYLLDKKPIRSAALAN